MCNYKIGNIIPIQKMLAYLPVFPSKISMANQHFWINKDKNLNKIHKMLIVVSTKAS